MNWITAELPQAEILRGWGDLTPIQKTQYFAIQGHPSQVEFMCKEFRIRGKQRDELMSIATTILNEAPIIRQRVFADMKSW